MAGGAQTKRVDGLRVGDAGDPLEREADRVAEQVSEPMIQRKCAGCSEDEQPTLRRTPRAGAPTSASAASLKLGSGGALSPALRRQFEPRFGWEFGAVRIHTGPEAARASELLGARAFTAGHDIAFAAGEYQPESASGRHLLAHELAHVVQQAEHGPMIQRNKDESFRRRVIPPLRLQLSASDLRLWEPLALRLPPLTFGEPRSSFSFGIPPLRPPSGSPVPPPIPPPVLPRVSPSTLSPPSTTPPYLTPPPSSSTISPSAAPLPTRLSLLSTGPFSFGGRIGFPEAPTGEAVAEAIRRAEFEEQMITGTFPTGWDAIDKGQFAQIAWSIFSTQLFPQVDASFTRALASMPRTDTSSGVAYELDLTLLTTPGLGGGVSFQLLFP